MNNALLKSHTHAESKIVQISIILGVLFIEIIYEKDLTGVIDVRLDDLFFNDRDIRLRFQNNEKFTIIRDLCGLIADRKLR